MEMTMLNYVMNLANKVERLCKIEAAAKDFVAVWENVEHWDIRQWDKTFNALKEALQLEP
jgi:hypothetical protein